MTEEITRTHIMRVIYMLQENNEPCSFDGIYVCSSYTDKNELLADLNELVEAGVLAWLSDGTYTRALSTAKATMEERARQEVDAIRKK